MKLATIKIDNSCYKNGALHQRIGTAKVDPKDTKKTNAKLLVDFFGLDFPVGYLIVRLDKDYSYSVVSSDDYKHLWILCRSPEIS